MKYDEFRELLRSVLHEAGLLSAHAGDVVERIDLATTDRDWKAFVSRFTPQKAEPFHISARIAFRWTPFEAARSYTCEEDLLAELVGRRGRPARTAPRFVRVDLRLSAKLPYGSTTPIPDRELFGAWTASVGEKLGTFFDEVRERQGRVVAVLGARGDVEVETRCAPEGVLSLQGVSVSGFRMVRLPRVWDDPARREAEKGAGNDLRRLAALFKSAFDEWTGRVAELAAWLRYSAPPPGAGPIEPRFDDDEPDEDGGPGTIH